MSSLNNEYQHRIANFILLLTGFLTLCGILLAGVLHWQWLSWQMLQWQGQLHKEMAVLLRAALTPNPETKMILLGLCFLYGVFHAVGPGRQSGTQHLSGHAQQSAKTRYVDITGCRTDASFGSHPSDDHCRDHFWLDTNPSPAIWYAVRSCQLLASRSTRGLSQSACRLSALSVLAK